MLNAQNRLTKKKDFDVVFTGGKSIKSDIVWCKVLANSLSQSRVGFVVSKKISQKATVRNTVKRRLRNAVADIIDSVKGPVDIVMVALPSIKNKDFSYIKEEVIKLMSKITH